MFQERTIANTNYAGVTFLTSFHMTSWKTTNQSSELFIEEFLNSTHAFNDRKKYMFIPIRMQQGTCWSHSCTEWKPYKKHVFKIINDFKNNKS